MTKTNGHSSYWDTRRGMYVKVGAESEADISQNWRYQDHKTSSEKGHTKCAELWLE